MKDNLSFISLVAKLSTLTSTSDIEYSNMLQSLQQWNFNDLYMNFNNKWMPNNPSQYTIIEDFANPIGWFGSPTLVVTDKGVSQAIIGSTSSILSKDFSSPLSIYENLIFNFSVSNTSSLNFFNILLSDNKNFNNRYGLDISSKLIDGDNKLIIKRSDFQVIGSAPSWDNITSILISFKYNDPLKESTVTTGSIISYTPKAMCTIAFADAWETSYSVAYPKMKAKNFSGEAAAITSYIGILPFCTLPMLQELYNNGWEITNHSASHQDLTQIPADQAEAEIKDALDYLLNAKFGLGSFFFSPPYGNTNSYVQDIIKKYAISSAYKLNSSNPNPDYDLLNLSLYAPLNTTTVSEITGWIDDAIAHGNWLILIFHQLISPAVVDIQFEPDKFQQVLDYLDSKRDEIEVLTGSDIIVDMYGTSLLNS